MYPCTSEIDVEIGRRFVIYMCECFYHSYDCYKHLNGIKYNYLVPYLHDSKENDNINKRKTENVLILFLFFFVNWHSITGDSSIDQNYKKNDNLFTSAQLNYV